MKNNFYKLTAHGSRLKAILTISFVTAAAFSILAFTTGCNNVRYGFKDVGTIPDSIKTVKVINFENRSRYVNPQLSPKLGDKLRQKIVGQTRLSQTNSDNADWEITGEIRDYSVSTSGISNQQTASNRLSVSIHIVLNDRKRDKTTEYDVSRNFEFAANLSIQQAEIALIEEMTRGLTDDIFNRIFSNW
ncbi:MAG TPA: LptE family protein [Chitinophagaceae bacterium]